MRLLAWSAIVALAILVAVPAARAQRTTQIAVGGGSAFSVGGTDSLYKPGPSGLVGIVTALQGFPLGLRLDYSYTALRGRTTRGTTRPDVLVRGITGSAVVSPTAGYVKPYLLAGGGWYPVREPHDHHRYNEFGADAGLGLTFPVGRAAAFLEARYHWLNSPVEVRGRHFVPVTLGLLL